MKRFVQVFILFVVIYAVNCKPKAAANDEDDYDLNVAEPETGIQNDNNYDYGETDGYDDVEPEIPNPILQTRPQDFVAKENETVQLPCQLENGETLVSMWRKNDVPIFQDSIKFEGVPDNYKLVNRTLIISDVGANETASYTCVIPLIENQSLQVTHRLFVQTAPKIVSLRAQNDITQLDAGKSLVLICKAIGFPPPTIKWSRKGHRLGTEGETVTIENISHHDAGDYQCLADNNIEPPAHEFIHIGVTHKPVIKIEKVIVNSDNNLDEELVCEVYSIPRADVIWKRDGVNVVSNNRIHFKNYNHTHILQIRMIQKEDLGVYTCSAKNRIGKTEKNVVLTMKPSPAKHIKLLHDPEKTTLIWEVNSKAPVTQFVLEYKKSADSEWKSVHPEVRNPDGNIYIVNHTLEHLPGGHYETRVKSQNSYGWSEWSSVVMFKSEHHKHNHVVIDKNTTKANIHDKDVYETHSLENRNLGAETPLVIQETQAPLGKISEEQQIQNTDKTQGDAPQTQQTKGGKGSGAETSIPLISLIGVTLLSAILNC